MKIIIDDKVLSKYKLSKEQFFFMLSCHYRPSDLDVEKLLNRKFYITQMYNGGLPQQNYSVSHAGIDIINKIILESEYLAPDQKERLELLAKKLQSIFPEGKKQGTNNYWRGNLPEIRDRLQGFFKRYGNYSDDSIIQATESYIESYKANTTLMRTLKYFISKKTDDGIVSDLLTFMDNIGSQNTEYVEVTKLV